MIQYFIPFYHQIIFPGFPGVPLHLAEPLSNEDTKMPVSLLGLRQKRNSRLAKEKKE